MKRQIVLIRHGETAGNLEKRYVGRTDEPLCEEGIAGIEAKKSQGLYPPAADDAVVLVSPMKRCSQTASLIYPQLEQITVEGLRECDFGSFEYRNYIEMAGDAEYQAWIDSGGKLPFPGGEDPDDFRERSRKAFRNAVERYRDRSQLIFVVHGGTIMSVMSAFAKPPRGYFDYSVANGHGFVCGVSEGISMQVEGEI